MTALVDRIEAELRAKLPGDTPEWAVGFAVAIAVIVDADPDLKEIRIIPASPPDALLSSSPQGKLRAGEEVGTGMVYSPPTPSPSSPMPEWEVRWLAVRSMEVFLPHTSCWVPVTRPGAETLQERHGWRSRPRNRSPRELRAAALLDSEGGDSGGGMFANAETETEIEGVG